MSILRTSIALAAFGLLANAITSPFSAVADARKGKAMTATTHPAEPVFTTINRYMPKGYEQTSQRAIAVDKGPAALVRYERIDKRNAGSGGEHFSTVIADDGVLKGFARIDLDLVGGVLPSREEARGIAMDFLAIAAPDLLATHKVSWIEPHDEPLRVTRNGKTEDLTLTGMKVKMQNTADGRWMWVIVRADRQVMIFERDIVWISFPGHRGTEKWLHDSWLKEKGLNVLAS